MKIASGADKTSVDEAGKKALAKRVKVFRNSESSVAPKSVSRDSRKRPADSNFSDAVVVCLHSSPQLSYAILLYIFFCRLIVIVMIRTVYIMLYLNYSRIQRV